MNAVTPKAKEVPSEEEQRVHRLTHLPYADWCRTCIQAKARDDPHRPVAHAEDEVPVVELDYMHLKSSQPGDSTVPVLIGAVKGSSYGMAAKSETMGRADREAIICFCKFLQEAGLMGTLRLRSDQGPAAMAVAQEVAARRHPAHTIVETTPRASHSSLGGAERKCQTIAGQVRVLRIEVEERWKIPVLATSPIMKYIIRHASWTTNRFQPTRGTTPYQDIQKHPYRGTVYGIAEPVLLRVGDLSDIAKIDSRWRLGVWLGKEIESDEHIVVTKTGIFKGRSIRPLPPTEVPEDLYQTLQWEQTEQVTPPQEGQPPMVLPSGTGPAGVAVGLTRQTDIAGNERTKNFREFVKECGATEACPACDRPSGRRHTAPCIERRQLWETWKRRCDKEKDDLELKKRRLEQTEVGKRKVQETDVKEKEKAPTSVFKKDKKMEDIPKEKRKVDWDGSGASDAKNPAKVAKEMQKGFERAEDEEMDKEKLREAKRSFEAEFGGDDAEEYLARTRTMSEEVSLVSSSGPPYFDAVSGEQLPEDLVEKGMKAERESLEKFPVYEEVPETEVKEVGGKLIKSRWVFHRKSEDRVKGRIVAQQLNLGEWADTFAATPTSLGQRVLMKIASEKGFVLKLGDISCAFPYAHLPPEEKLYLMPPESERKPGKIWKLLRALYGLRRSPQFFQDHFAAELEKMGFRRLLSDPQLFIHEELQVYLLAHVDDMMIAGTHVNVEKVVKMLDDIFKIKWAEELNSKNWTKFLGREWKREAMTENNKDIGFCVRIPPTYFKKVLKDFAMEKCKEAATPFVPGVRHREDEELAVDEVKHHQYRRAVGQLLWTVGERPDLSYVIKELARRVQRPSEEDWCALKRVLHYIKGTMYAELHLKTNSKNPTGINVITDANWAAPLDGRSTTGFSIWWDGFLLTHRSKTQSTVAQSTCESELLALGAGVMDGRFAQTIVEEMGEKVALEAYCDSSSAVAITVRRGLGRLRHLNVKQMWLQQEVREKRLTVNRVPSEQNVSDLFTKAFLGPRFRVLLDMIGLDVQPARSVNTDE